MGSSASADYRCAPSHPANVHNFYLQVKDKFPTAKIKE
jgi:hypothetical protein